MLAILTLGNNMVGQLITTAFCEARSRYAELNNEWVKLSYIIGGKLPASTVLVSVQQIGDLDILLRCMEDEFVEINGENAELFSKHFHFHFHYQYLISKMWIASAYEIIRLFNERFKKKDNATEIFGADFERVYELLTLVRVPLEKHELAKDRKLKEGINFVRYPLKSDGTDEYIYNTQDNMRSHNVPVSFSERGSVKWCVVDVKKTEQIWVERRKISELFMSC